MDNQTGIYSIFAGAWTIMIVSVITLWKKIGSFVTKDELKEDLKQEADHRISVNMDLLQRMTAVETKVEIGFKMLGDKIDGK